VQLLLEKAKLLTRFGEFEQAEELYHKAMFSDPSNYKELLDFAYRLKDAGLFNRAIQQIEHIPGELTFLQKMEIVTFCRALLDNDPHNIQALTKLAYFYGEMNDIFQLSSVYLSLFRVYMQQQSYERAHQAGKLLLDLGYRDSKFLKAYEQNKSHLKLNEDAQLREQGPTVQTENLVKLDTSKVRLWPNTCLETQEVEAKALSHKEEGLPDMLLNIELLLKYGARDKALELLQQSVRDFGDNPELREKLRNYYLAKSPVAYAALESMRLSEMVKDRVEKKKSGKIPAYRPPASEMATAITARSPLSAEELVVQDALPGFTGDLRMFMLIDIIQLISASNKTGTLCVINGDNTGLAYFNSGRLVSSEYGNYAGEEAVFQLLQVNDGFFEFRPSEAPFRESIEISTTNLLLEGLRRIDEQRRNNASAASSAEIGEIEERFGS
jgi:tetratricopeptide (TPR) repeat protein